MRVIEHRFHTHCAHCGDEMRIEMDKTIDVDDTDYHWLVTPCECLAQKRIAELELQNITFRNAQKICKDCDAFTVAEHKHQKALLDEIEAEVHRDGPTYVSADKIRTILKQREQTGE